MLPLVFGICFQTPLVMFFLERIGIVTAEELHRSGERKFAILIMVAVAGGADARARIRLQPVHARGADDRPL